MNKEITKKTKSIMNMMMLDYKELFSGTDEFNLVKQTLKLFYILNLIGTITMSTISFTGYGGYYYGYSSMWIAVKSFALVYQLILTGVGLIGVDREMKYVMIAWSALSLIALIANGVLFGWMSSFLVAFTGVLTGFYAFMIHKKYQELDPDSKHSIRLNEKVELKV